MLADTLSSADPADRIIRMTNRTGHAFECAIPTTARETGEETNQVARCISVWLLLWCFAAPAAWLQIYISWLLCVWVQEGVLQQHAKSFEQVLDALSEDVAVNARTGWIAGIQSPTMSAPHRCKMLLSA